MFYVCILDFEATCFEGAKSNDKPHEIIEFPSVLLQIEEKKVTKIDEFQEYCKPVINPKLSKFCTDLTGIGQETVDKADAFPNVFYRHYQWLQKHLKADDKCVIVTCGAWDLNVMLPIELKKWSTRFDFFSSNSSNLALYRFVTNPPKFYRNYVNIKQKFEEFYNDKAGGMPTMLKKLKLSLDGRHHSGIDDCKNISKIFEKNDSRRF
jgi:ERI1 exoribonuclease 3